MRIVKSVIAVILCFEVYVLIGEKGMPFYAAIAALQCIQPYMSETDNFARKRIRGTLVGGFWGFVVVMFCAYVCPQILQHDALYYLMVSLLTGVVIYTTVVLDIKNTAYFSAVVFLSIVVNHGWDEVPLIYVIGRVMETYLGVAVGILLSKAHLPRRVNNDTLFVTGIDNTLTAGRSPISDYSRIELNRLIQQGAKVSIATRQTPAAIRENLSGVQLKLPVIVMDGAALYDMSGKRYLETVEMSEADAQLISEYLDAKGIHYCTNKIIDDLLIIYYDDRANEVERQVIEERRTSPYRNYVRRRHPVYEHVVYLFLILPDEECQALFGEMMDEPWADRFRVVMEPMEGHPGSTFLKIYSPDANRESLLEHLKARVGAKDMVIFGCGSRRCDVYIENADKDVMVRELKRRYEPVCWFGGR